MNAPSTLDDVIKDLGEISQSLNIETYMVGGFVRDRILRRPSKDVDCVVVGEGGERLIRALSKRYGWGEPAVFARFGTVHIRSGELIVEAVMARSEEYNPHSRKPNVKPGTLEEDIWRRDFTINSLAQRFDGTIVDITGRGIEDLRSMTLRTPLDPEITFAEDPLRMFRAARFVAKLDVTPVPELMDAMRAMAERTKILSVERIADELRQILVAPFASKGLDILRQGGLLQATFPELYAMVGCNQDERHHLFDVWGHSLAAVDNAPPEPLVRLAALVHDIGKPATLRDEEDGRRTFYGHDDEGGSIAAEMLRRLRFPEADITAVETLIKLHLRPILYNEKQGDASVRRLIRAAGPLRHQLMQLARADALASKNKDIAFLDELDERMNRLDKGGEVSLGIVTLSGEELMQMAGRGPGRWIKGVKRALEEAVLEGELQAGDSEAAKIWIQERPQLLQEPVDIEL